VEAKSHGSAVSKPFLICAVVSVFAGSLVGAVWLISLLGARLPAEYLHFSLHRVLQMNGFLTLLVMGVGYMIVPRFRNTALPSAKLAYLSLALVVGSLAASITHAVTSDEAAKAIGYALGLAGSLTFAVVILWLLRIPPRLLRLSDGFIALSVICLVAVNAVDGVAPSSDHLSLVQLWMLFPTLMIFGIEYKTMPSFLGFIRPKKKLGQSSFVAAAVALVLGIAQSVSQDYVLPVALAFNIALLVSAALVVVSLFIYGGFNYNQITSLLSGERKARYSYTLAYSRLAYAFLFLGIGSAVLFHAMSANYGFLFYDLAIHFGAIGFIGITVALYLPLMLPPILGRQVQFAKFSHAPVLLLSASLGIRVLADFFIGTSGAMSYVLMTSGWLVVAALGIFVVMLHKSMIAQ
jgi:hypothetical protein